MLENRKLLKIDLTTSRVTIENIPEEILRKYLGGKGINIYYLLKYTEKDTEPFSEENPLIFSNGLLTGTSALSSSRIHIGSISPLTGLVGSSNAGGFFGKELSDCGYLTVIVEGKAPKPVYILIKNENIEIRDAVNLWGLDTKSAWQTLVNEAGLADARVALIGPAGENRVKFASIIFPPDDAAGRTGLGAVMGSKNLKAIMVKSAKQTGMKLNQRVKELNKKILKTIKQSDDPDFKDYTKHGDSTYVRWLNDLQAGCVYNFRDVAFKEIETADGLYLDRFKTNIKSCYNCPIRCRAEVEIDVDGMKISGERPPFEPMVLLGPRIGNFNAAQTVYLHTLCNRYGLDSIDTGSILGFLMDIYDRKIIGKEELGGIDLKWGDIKASANLIRQIAFRKTKIGDILAEGLFTASKRINRGAEKYAYHVKGLSLPAMDPRGFKASALGYAVSSRGADFTSVYARQEYSISIEEAKRLYGTEKAADRLSEESKPKMLKDSFIASAVVDSLGLCKITYLSFLGDYGLKTMYEISRALTEWYDFDVDDLYKVGMRVVTLERVFNIRRGASSKYDYLPEKFLKEPIKRGMCKGSMVNLEPMKLELYKLMGWDHNGYPGSELIKQLGLDKDISMVPV